MLAKGEVYNENSIDRALWNTVWHHINTSCAGADLVQSIWKTCDKQ